MTNQLSDTELIERNRKAREAAIKALGQFYLGRPDAITPKKRKALARIERKRQEKMASKFLRREA